MQYSECKLNHLYSTVPGVFFHSYPSKFIRDNSFKLWSTPDMIPVSTLPISPKSMTSDYELVFERLVPHSQMEEFRKVKHLVKSSVAANIWYNTRGTRSNIKFLEDINAIYETLLRELVDDKLYLFGARMDEINNSEWAEASDIYNKMNNTHHLPRFYRAGNMAYNKSDNNMALDTMGETIDYFYVTCLRREYLEQYLRLYFDSTLDHRNRLVLAAQPNPAWFKTFYDEDRISGCNRHDYLNLKLNTLKNLGVEVVKGSGMFDDICKPVNLDDHPTLYDSKFDKSSLGTYGIQSRELISAYADKLIKF